LIFQGFCGAKNGAAEEPEKAAESKPPIHVIPGPSQRVRPELAGPMTGSARNPESIIPAQRLWIPGPPLHGDPE
jgi:hypothetical protein